MSEHRPGAVVETRFRRLVDLLDQRVDGMAEDVVARAAQEWPDWSSAARPELQEPIRRVARDSIRAEIAALREGRLPHELTAADADFAREAARMAVPVSALGWSFRAGHAVQWQHWLELVEREECEPTNRRQLLERGSQFFFAYADRLIQ